MTNGIESINPVNTNHLQTSQIGLTKREYFAAMALQGLLSHPSNTSMEARVKASVKAADLLIDELNKI